MSCVKQSNEIYEEVVSIRVHKKCPVCGSRMYRDSEIGRFVYKYLCAIPIAVCAHTETDRTVYPYVAHMTRAAADQLIGKDPIVDSGKVEGHPP